MVTLTKVQYIQPWPSEHIKLTASILPPPQDRKEECQCHDVKKNHVNLEPIWLGINFCQAKIRVQNLATKSQLVDV